MKASHIAIVKSAVDVMQSNTETKLVIQRIANSPSGKRYVQIMTPLGVITTLDKGSLAEPDYPIQEIGAPAQWSKLSKGIIISKSVTDVPFTAASNASRIGDAEIATAEHLLSVETGLAPISVLTHPGIQLAYADAPGSAVWTYNPSGGVLLTNHVAQWSRNAENCVGVYAAIKPWVKAVIYSMPKDSETGYPQKLSGVSMGPVGSHIGIHLVSHELSMVISCISAVHPTDIPASYILDGKLKNFILTPDSTFIKQEEEFDVKANIIDLSALQQTTATPAPSPAPAVSEPAPADISPTPEPVAGPTQLPDAVGTPAAEISEPPVTTTEVSDQPELPTIAAIEPEEQPSAPAKKSPEEPAEIKSADEQLNDLILKLEEQTKVGRSLLADAKAFRKQYKAESKDSKATAKLTADNAKLKEELAELKSKCAAQEATLNKFKALLG